jgi:hypothetical protein
MGAPSLPETWKLRSRASDEDNSVVCLEIERRLDTPSEHTAVPCTLVDRPLLRQLPKGRWYHGQGRVLRRDPTFEARRSSHTLSNNHARRPSTDFPKRADSPPAVRIPPGPPHTLSGSFSLERIPMTRNASHWVRHSDLTI